jgi:3-oxoacyl-[acyl-carrier protein] reductase
MDIKLKDKCALVIGSSRGLGYATALALAKEGCKVAINGRDEVKIKSVAEKLSKETGSQVIGLAGDVSLTDVPEKLIHQTVDAFGGLDILITNAGGPPPGTR